MAMAAPHEVEADAADSGPDSPPENSGESGKRGFLVIVSAKVFFILTGFGIKFTLPYLLGSPAEFGFYETAMGAISILNMVLITSTIQTVSRFVSGAEPIAGAVLRQGLAFQCLVGGFLGLLVFLGAGALASFLEDPALTTPLRISAVVVVAYALYAAMVGTLNGLRRFSKQAKLDATFSLFRSVGIIGGAALGFGVTGALFGFAGAAVGILIVALFTVRALLRGRSEEERNTRFPIPAKDWLTFLLPIWLYQAALNGCLQVDVLVLKKTFAELAMSTGVTAERAAELASEQVGYYRAAQTFAFVPYQLILSVTFIIFPFVARATSSGDEAEATSAVGNALRFSLLVLLAVAAPISGAAIGVIDIAYPEIYAGPGHGALEILAFGLVAFALFVISATILSGAGRPGVAAVVAVVSLVALVFGGRQALFLSETGDALVALSMATSLSMVLALVLASVSVFRRFRTFIPILSAVRGTLAAACAWLVSHEVLTAFSSGGTPAIWHTLSALVVGGLVFLVVLFVSRELTVREVRGLLRRK